MTAAGMEWKCVRQRPRNIVGCTCNDIDRSDKPTIQTEERRPFNPADDEKYSKAVHFSAVSIVDCGWRTAGRSTISGGRTIMMNCRLGLGYERALVLFGSMSIQYLFIYIYMCTGFNDTQCNTVPPPLLLLVVFIVMVGD